MTDNEKIRAIRGALDMTMEAFGKRIGVSRAAISNIENGNRGITNQLATSICREYNVNPEYLSGESDQMFLQVSKSEQLAAFFGDVLQDEEDDFRRRFISALAQMSTAEWKLLEKILDRMQIKKD